MSTVERGSSKEADTHPQGQVQPLCCPRPETPSAPGPTRRSTATLCKHSRTWHLAVCLVPILRIFSCSITRPIDRKHSTHPWAGLCTRVCLTSAWLSGPHLSCWALSQLLGEARGGAHPEWEVRPSGPCSPTAWNPGLDQTCLSRPSFSVKCGVWMS